MKPWTYELLLGVIITTLTGIAVGVLMPLPTLFFWIIGVAMGYGLRIGIVNVWPHIFKPRIAYKEHRQSYIGED